jgi:hypothetical protein
MGSRHNGIVVFGVQIPVAPIEKPAEQSAGFFRFYSPGKGFASRLRPNSGPGSNQGNKSVR